MKRLTALIVASTLATMALPMSAAFAAGEFGTAEVTAGADVLPTANQSFSITVKAAGTAAPLPGVPGSGTTLNWVRVTFPADEAGVRNNDQPIVQAGWTATKTNLGSLQRVTFTGGSIPPGGTATFSFPASVSAPQRADKIGEFVVALSGDNGANVKGAPAPATKSLATKVRALELLADAANKPRPVAPAGVVDRTGTAGQAVSYSYAVKNHALEALTVTPALTSNGPDTVGSGSAVPVQPGQVATLTAPVTLRSGITSDATAIFTATAATAGNTAVARPANSDPFTVQVANRLDKLINLQPTRVRAASDAPYSFSATATKAAGTPSLTLKTGTMSFAGNTLTMSGEKTLAGGASATTSINYAEKTLTGTDGSYTPTASFTGEDANGFPFSGTVNVEPVVTIDNLAPIIGPIGVTLPTTDGIKQTAAKSGDSIAISGEVQGTDVDANSITVTLDPDKGADVPVTVTKTTASDKVSYSGTVRPTFDAGTTSFVVKVQAKDVAGNSVGRTSIETPVDLIIPALINPARTESPTLIRTSFNELDVRGGCSPSMWQVDGNAVEAVYFDGQSTPCALNTIAPGGSGVRILKLRFPIQENDAPAVTYSPLSRTLGVDPAKDGAANDAITQKISTVVGIIPAAPELTKITRNNTSEAAYQDPTSGKYYTRFAGTDNNNASDEDLQACFLGSRNAYVIQVLDGGGRVIHSAPVSGPSTPTDANERCVRVPIGATNGDYARALRFLGSNLEGEQTPFTAVLDTVKPATASLSRVGNEVTVTFNDVVIAGDDFASDWVAYENITNNDGTPGRAYSDVETVSDPGNGTTRKLTVAFRNVGPFGGVEYLHPAPTAGRYQDRAGNLMDNTLTA